MNKQNTRKWIAALLITMLTFMGLGQSMVYAVEDEGHNTDVIITKLESDAGAENRVLDEGEDYDDPLGNPPGTPLQGVSFTYYSVSKTQLDMMINNPGDYDTASDVEALPGVGAGVSTGETGTNGQVTAGNLGEGFYWFIENPKGTVVSSAAVPFGLALPFTNKEGTGYLDKVHVYPKNVLTDDEPDIEKTIDESNVAIGDLNTWIVSLDIPVGIEDYDKFSFYDDIDSRLDFEGLAHVIAEADGTNLIKGTDYTVAYADPRLDVVFTEAGRTKLKDTDPKKVDVTIKTRVNDSAIMGQEIENDATLEFNNGHGVDKEKTVDDIPSVHTGGKAFKKMDGSSEALLEGAEFKIKGPEGFVIVNDDGSVTFGAEDDATVFVSNSNGHFEVRGLPYGDYTLVEIKAPQGYALPTDPNTGFEVDETSYYQDPTAIELGDADANVFKYINNRRLVIPQTGGIGTALFTVVGAVVMLFSVVFYRKTSRA